MAAVEMPRDFIGYGWNPSKFEWPGGAMGGTKLPNLTADDLKELAVAAKGHWRLLLSALTGEPAMI